MEQIERNEYPLPQEETLDIKKLFFQVLGNWYWFAISIFAGLFISYLVNRYSEQIYSVRSSLIVKDDENTRGLSGAENLIQGLKLVRNTKSVQNEIGILKSYTVAYQAISELPDFWVSYVAVGRRGIKESKLYTGCPFVVTYDSLTANITSYPAFVTILSPDSYLLEIDDGMNVRKKMKFGERFTNHAFDFAINLRFDVKPDDNLIGKKYYFTFNSLTALAKAYQSKVTVDLNDKKGSILTLTTSGFVAEQEADYLNKVMEVYIRRGLDEKNQIADNTVKFIDIQLREMEDSLRTAEQNLLNFRLQNRVIDISKEGTSIYTKLQRLQDQFLTLELSNRYYTYLDDYLKTKTDLADIVAPTSMGVDDVQLNMLLQQISQTVIEYQTLSYSAKPGSPIAEELNNRISTLRKTLEEKVSSLQEANGVAKREISRQVKLIEDELMKLPYQERMLINIEREYNLVDKLYTYLMEKRAEAAIAKASNIPDNKVLDFALPVNATQIKPNRKMNYIMGFIVGLGLPFVVIVLFNILNTRIVDLKIIAQKTSVPLLGTVGHNRFNSELPTIDKPKSTLAESFRGLRTNLQYLLRDPEKKVIAISSTISGEGKTFIAANLAAIIATTGKRVLIVGMDLRKPKLHRYFGGETQIGLSTYLIGRSSFNDAVQQTAVENLYMVAAGPIPPNPAELIGSETMDRFINEAKRDFDFVIIDTPPVAVVTDALLTSRFSNILLYVVRFNYSDVEVLKLVEDIRKNGEQQSLAIVVNDLQQNRRYGYAYTYGYSYNYGYSYGYGRGYGYSQKGDGGYYADDEPPITWKERFKRLF